MQVKILNPESVKDLFHSWGETSKHCYGTETDNPERIGIGCYLTEHYSGSRGDYIKFLIEDCPRFTIDQAVRHEVGVFKNVGSFRYIDKDGFAYEVPTEITDNEKLLAAYDFHMITTAGLYSEIQEYVYNKTNSHERANEQARYILPMSTHSSFVIGFTIEALIHFMNMRLCSRAEDKIRELAILMKAEILEILPEISDKLVPNCVEMMYCPEGTRGCGAYPTKKKLKEIIEKGYEVENKKLE